MIGQKLNNRYEIKSRLGKGAMGTVYHAIDSQTGHEVALKLISSELAVDPQMLERFKREGESLRALKHLNIVGFIDAFQHDEHYVIVMEYVPGGSLFELIKAGPLPIERARQIALDLCDALIRSHRLNIIHRDIKPENILIAEDGTPKLADFGVAHLSEGTRITRSGTQVGTPYYMAPEAWSGHTDAQSDIWSLGVVLFEMLTAQVPFDGDTGPVVMNKVLTTPPPDLNKLRADVSPSLVKIVGRMLTRDKRRRYQTMREVAVDLERDQQASTPITAKGKPAPKRPGPVNKKIIGLGIAGIVILVLGIGGALGLKILIQNLPVPTSATSSTEDVATPALSTTSTPALAEEITDARGISMRLVPAGTFTMGSEEYDVTKPIHEVFLDSFYIDKNEATNALYKTCVDEGVCDPPKEISSSTRAKYWAQSEFDDYPVIHVDWDMAKTYCEWREASLPTEAQWEKAARGTDHRTYPWGDSYAADHANDINQKAGDTAAVGSYEIGKSPYGIYDMSGNVDEWVADRFSDTYYQNSPSTNPLGPETGEFRVLRGGSWNDNTQTYYRDNNGPSFSSDDVGFRCALSTSATATQSNTPTSISTLTTTSLLNEITDDKGVQMALVPAGTFTMGMEKPNDWGWGWNPADPHEVYLDPYYMDIYEVTNASYKQCVDIGACIPPLKSSIYINLGFIQHPVSNVDWDMAETYCEWRGARLPTEAEWEKAARGTDARTYPWGEDISCEKANYYFTCVDNTTEVGSYESGKSPYGMYDMAGNVAEWVNDWYSDTYYQSSPSSNPLGPETGQYRVQRGGTYSPGEEFVRSAVRSGGIPTDADRYIGFRCARGTSP